MWQTLAGKTRGALSARALRLMAFLWAALVGLALFTVLFGRWVYLSWGFLWNVCLAVLPLLFCLPLVWRQSRGQKGPLTILWGLLWLFTLPNAPYMLTDLIHLGLYEYNAGFHLNPNPTAWLGLAHIAGAVALGCAFGFLSLYLLHGAVRAGGHPVRGWLFCAGASALAGVGIYIGRFMRFNSWDIITRPLDILRQMASRLSPHAAAFCLLFAAMVFGGYLLFYLCFDSTAAQNTPPGG